MAALTLAIAFVMAQGLPYGNPAGPIYSQTSTGSTGPFFEFAPTSGAGMGTACACTTVTGAKGEVVTFTRASSAYCTKEGLATTGLTTTSMVLCGTNQIRVEADGSGVLGILTENARTNIVIQSQDIMDATWGLFFSGVGTPVRTSNQGVAPDGTTTADRLQVPACPTAGHYSVIGQALTATAAAKVASVYVKGYAGSDGGIQIQTNDPGGAGVAKICSYNPDTWTRCSTASFTYAGTGNQVFIGCNNTAAVGGANSGAADVLIWQTDLVDGAYATSPIPTTTAAVTRALDVLTVNGNALGFPGAPFSVAATATLEWPNASAPSVSPFVEGFVSTTSGAGLFFVTSNVRFATLNSGSLNVETAGRTVVPGTAYRAAGANTNGTSAIYWDGTLTVGPSATNDAGVPWSTTTGIGYYTPSSRALDGIISRVCVDPSATRCR